ncbi:MAG TPA: hypothetical protein GXX36_02155 [Clostridiaceae bacterium]|nr:hypothetical protein [Clostridiaceae bacterium]
MRMNYSNYYNYSNYSIDNKIIIKCGRCFTKLRVPLDKGKISVVCPLCRNEFIYNPNSIFHTLKQIVVSIRCWLAKSRKNKIVFIIILFAILAMLYFGFIKPGSRQNGYRRPQINDMQPGTTLMIGNLG